jgi:hypothetical protein
MGTLVGRRAFDGVEAQVVDGDPLPQRVIADLRPVAQHRLQASQALHLQQAAQGVVAIVKRQALCIGLLNRSSMTGP